MANAEEKSLKASETPSMEEILQSIRGVISGDDGHDESDVLELVEVVEEGSMLNALKPGDSKGHNSATNDFNPEKSILDDIDAALEDDVSKTPVFEEPLESALKEDIAPEPQIEDSVKMPEEEEVVETITTPEVFPIEHHEEPEIINHPEIEPHNSASSTENSTKNNHPKSGNSGRLLDEQAAKQSAVSLKELVSTIHDKHIDSPYTRGGTSLEDLVIEAMKPFLAEWLNKNLPAIVKKIVEKEVKSLIPQEEDDY